MADIRIKDLATTATTTASDDFMAVDGATNGTRKLSAAAPAFLTSVTTPSLTSPAATNLTLAGGSSGASLVLGQGANANNSLLTTGTGRVTLQGQQGTTIAQGNESILFSAQNQGPGNLQLALGMNETGGFFPWFQSFRVNGGSGSYLVLQPAAGNVLIGGTTDISGSGGLKIFGTTAGSSGAGALVVAGGLATGADSYIGGKLTQSVAAGTVIQSLVHTSPTAGVYQEWKTNSTTDRAYIGTANQVIGGGSIADFAINSVTGNVVLGTASAARLTLSSTTATFAGAVTAAVVTSTGAGYTNSGFQITNTSASRTTGFFLTNAGVTTIRDVTGVYDLFTINTSGNAGFSGTISPQQTGTPPTYVKGAIYFDTALNKLRVGGLSGWETITSV